MTILDKIFEYKREEVAAARAQTPLAELKAIAADQPAPLGFVKALDQPSLSLIAEIKKASPSEGLIRADFDPAAIAKIYKDSGAQCLSVLTDGPSFQGSPENLRKAKAASGLPCLRKDFIDDPYQVYEARAMGADAILLIAASLETGTIRDLQGLAWELGMDVLVETHSPEEVDQAKEAKATFVGVNNRNLADFNTDLAISVELIPTVAPWAFAVSESALRTPDDLRRVAEAGARAVLIGTTFCRSADIGAKVREVMAI